MTAGATRHIVGVHYLLSATEEGWLIGLAFVVALAIGLWSMRSPNRHESRVWITGAAATFLLLVQLILVARDQMSPDGSGMTSPASLANFGFAVMIGLFVGATEMISRYRDQPFAPLISIPGALYILLNGGASALAYYLLSLLAPGMREPLRTFTAGVAAMTFFRSALFTVRLGQADVPVGPSLILTTLLRALDREYDRARAEPRAQLIQALMGNLAFDPIKNALPALCSGLMQNLSVEETATLNSQITDLTNNSTMSDQSKSLSLGLVLYNLVGQKTLTAAVATLGSESRAFRQVDSKLLGRVAIVDPDVVLNTLPDICAALGDAAPRTTLAGSKLPTPQRFEFQRRPGLSPDSQVVLLIYQLVAFYGDQLVGVATNLVKAAAPAPAPPMP